MSKTASPLLGEYQRQVRLKNEPQSHEELQKPLTRSREAPHLYRPLPKQLGRLAALRETQLPFPVALGGEKQFSRRSWPPSSPF
jgi:hypothetical protein